MPETDLAGAQSMAERICQGIRNLEILHDHMPERRVTVSIGVAVMWPVSASEHTALQLVKLADEALYRAKEEGRDRVCLAKVPMALMETEKLNLKRA